MPAPRKIAARRPTRVSKTSMQKRSNGELPPSGVRRSKRILELQGGTDLPNAQSQQSQRRLQKVAKPQETNTPRPAKRRKLSTPQKPKKSVETPSKKKPQKLSPTPLPKESQGPEGGPPEEKSEKPSTDLFPPAPGESGDSPPKRQSQKQSPKLQSVALPEVQFAAPGTNGLGYYRFEHIGHWASEGQVWPAGFCVEDPMDRIRAIKRVSATGSKGKRSDASGATTVTPNDAVGDKCAPYKDPNYENIMATQAGSYMQKFEPGISEASKQLCQDLMTGEQATPTDTLFRDDIFDETWSQWRNKNEARIFRDCTPLICPPAEPYFALKQGRGTKIAVESVNEGWNCSRPVIKTRPQPDYAVGFSLRAFNQEQLKKLRPAIGDGTSQSYFMGTYYMIFPFLTCEVKCGSGGLDIADRQNQHSMTLAVRGLVELFKVANREAELHREVLAWSISHDNEIVRIFGHFPVVEETKTTYWRVALRRFDFADQDGREKWTTYKFVKNIYDVWMPAHLKRICNVIDALPENTTVPSFTTTESNELESSGLSSRLGNQHFDVPGIDHGSANGFQSATPRTTTDQDGPALKRTKTTPN